MQAGIAFEYVNSVLINLPGHQSKECKISCGKPRQANGVINTIMEFVSVQLRVPKRKVAQLNEWHLMICISQ